MVLLCHLDIITVFIGLNMASIDKINIQSCLDRSRIIRLYVKCGVNDVTGNELSSSARVRLAAPATSPTEGLHSSTEITVSPVVEHQHCSLVTVAALFRKAVQSHYVIVGHERQTTTGCTAHTHKDTSSGPHRHHNLCSRPYSSALIP